MTIMGGTPDDPVSDGDLDDTPFGLSDQVDSLADNTTDGDDDGVVNPDLGDQGSVAPEAVRDPSGLSDDGLGTDGLQENPLG